MTKDSIHDADKERLGPRVTFIDCVGICAGQHGFVAQVDRLKGTHFGEIFNARGVAAEIDRRTGRFEDAMLEFSAIVYDLVWSRIPSGAL